MGTIITKNSNFEQQTHHRQARVIQYNKILKGLVAISSLSSSNSTKILTATRLAVQLLDRMMWSCEEDTINRSAEEEYHDSNNNNNVDELLVINTTTTTTTTTSIVPPDAKSFATVLGSPVL